MPRLERPLIVVSDTHLGPETPEAVARDLAKLVASNAGAEIVLSGDVFDLSFAPRYEQSADFLAGLLGRVPELGSAIHRHVAGGAPITVLPGNHDAALGERQVADAFRVTLGLSESAPVHVSPWFLRRGDVHVEHGHVYDPDNAPVHPLAEWTGRTEPLGIALTRRFVAASGASIFAHAQNTTPVNGLARAFRRYGFRAPRMIASYFKTAIELCAESGPAMAPHAERERGLGQERLFAFAGDVGVTPDALAELLARVPAPTHLNRRDVILRLYFDRVFATLLFVASAASIPRRPTASLLALASLAYLAGSTLRGTDRYGKLPQRRLSDGAARIREFTSARVVVLGHTHHPLAEHGYLNTGSFAFPRSAGRPYVWVDETGHAELRTHG
jgi:UDP-2,3-diacylglucosamine pyrophosphatase LpxH